MRAFYFPSVPDSALLEKLLPGGAPAEAPVTGRNFVDWALESACRFGVDSAVLVDKRISPALERRFAMDRDGLCAVSTMRLAKGLPQSLAEVSASPWFRGIAADGGSAIVVWGDALPLYKPEETGYRPVPQSALRDTPTGIYHWVEGRWLEPEAGAFAMRDAASWLDLSMRLLAGEGGFTLPGYSAENGAYLCRNVVLEHGTEAKPPVLMLDNAWCARDVKLENGVILGRNSFVGRGSRLSRTMVCDDTYIGKWLDLEGKIVLGDRIVDAATGACVDVEESAIARHGSIALPKWLKAAGRLVAGHSFGRGPF